MRSQPNASGVGAMSRKRNFNPRRLLPVLTLLMSFSLERAQAACTPEPPVNNATATCTGTTNNQSGTDGYGTIFLSNNIITIQPGASVTGTFNGVVLVTGTINNFGTALGTGINGVFVVGTGSVANSGLISGGNNGASITNGTLTNTNTGTITGGNVGVFFQDQGLVAGTPPSVVNAGAVTGSQFGIQFKEQNQTLGGVVTNSGTISATGANGIGISARTTATVSNDGSGVISGQQFGINASTANVNNSGRIESTAADGAAINAATATVTNFGTIAATTGFGAIAINAGGDVNVTNNSAGTISGKFIGVQAGGTATVNNAQGALIEATEPSFNALAIFGSAVSVQNSGTIRSLGASASGIAAGDGGLTVNNTSSGVISATRLAIASGGNLTVTGNEGQIEANSSSSFAISGQKDVSVTNGTVGTIRAFGNNSLAIVSNGTATVANGGGLIQTTGQDSFTIFGTNVKITGNTGTIEATGVNGIAIGARDTADVTNSRTIQSIGDNGIAIRTANALINNNAGGAIHGNSGAIRMDTGTINNAGTLSSTKPSNSIPTIFATTQATVNNSGTILAQSGGFGIEVPSGRLDLVNSGTIFGNGTAIGIDAAIANVTNTGTIDTGSDSIIARYRQYSELRNDLERKFGDRDQQRRGQQLRYYSGNGRRHQHRERNNPQLRLDFGGSGHSSLHVCDDQQFGHDSGNRSDRFRYVRGQQRQRLQRRHHLGEYRHSSERL